MAVYSFDIFQQLPDGAPIWIEAAPSLEQAKERLAELVVSKPGSYAIYDSYQAVFVTRFT